MLHSFNKVSLIPKKVIKEIIRENTLKKLIFKNPHVKKIKTHTEKTEESEFRRESLFHGYGKGQGTGKLHTTYQWSS